MHGPLVGVLEVAADRHADGDACHPHAERLQQTRQVERRGLAFHIGVGGEDDLGDVAAGDAGQQSLDRQFVGTDAL